MMLRRVLAVVLVAASLSPGVVRAQQAPTPVEVNTVIAAPVVLSTTGTVTVAVGGLPALGLAVQGTGSGLTAAVQGQTVPGGSWTTIPVVPYGGGAAVSSITGNGLWTVPTTVGSSAYAAVRLDVTALSGGSVTVVFGGATPLAVAVVNPDGTTIAGTEVSPYLYTDLGACQLTVGNAAVALSSCSTPGSGGIPAGANFATITVETEPVRWVGGTASPPANLPTQGFGNLAAVGASFTYSAPLANFRMNDTSAGSSTVDVEFFK